MRIGIYGGSFDPIHYGHLLLAERCREAAELDEVWFIPCAINPHKTEGAFGSDRQRSEMIELAISGYPPFKLNRIELDRGGNSFTVDTVTTISDQHPDDQLYLLMGDDSLESFSGWKEPGEICRLATPLIVNRPGSGNVDLSVLQPFVDGDRLAEIQSAQLESPMIDISSTDIRHRVQQGKSIRFLLPRGVEIYIQSKGLYAAES